MCLSGAHLPEAHSQHRPWPSGFSSCEPHTHTTWERYRGSQKVQGLFPTENPQPACCTLGLQGTLQTASWTYWARMGGLDT